MLFGQQNSLTRNPVGNGNLICSDSDHLELLLLLSCSVMFDSATLWTETCLQSSRSFTVSWSLLKLMSIKLMVPSNHVILCLPLFLLPSVFPSIMVFSNESVLHIRWPKYWSFSSSISPSNKYSGLIAFRKE